MRPGVPGGLPSADPSPVRPRSGRGARSCPRHPNDPWDPAADLAGHPVECWNGGADHAPHHRAQASRRSTSRKRDRIPRVRGAIDRRREGRGGRGLDLTGRRAGPGRSASGDRAWCAPAGWRRLVQNPVAHRRLPRRADEGGRPAGRGRLGPASRWRATRCPATASPLRPSPAARRCPATASQRPSPPSRRCRATASPRRRPSGRRHRAPASPRRNPASRRVRRSRWDWWHSPGRAASAPDPPAGSPARCRSGGGRRARCREPPPVRASRCNRSAAGPCRARPSPRRSASPS